MSARFKAVSDGYFHAPGLGVRCALGRRGVVQAKDKREGDGASPLGVWPVRRVFWRPDRVTPGDWTLEHQALRQSDGWCDAPDHPAYNTLVERPFEASHEEMWREDGAYDLVVELGYNDDPVVPGMGSAIFMHVAKPDYAPTEGCIALAKADLLAVLEMLEPWDEIEIMHLKR